MGLTIFLPHLSILSSLWQVCTQPGWDGVLQIPCQAGLELQSFWSQSPKYVGFQDYKCEPLAPSTPSFIQPFLYYWLYRLFPIIIIFLRCWDYRYVSPYLAFQLVLLSAGVWK
jgi:hypothetical protein